MSDKGNDACGGENGKFIFLKEKGPVKPTKGLLEVGSTTSSVQKGKGK